MYCDTVQAARLKWRIGDLGRFRSEDARRPRFEVINASKAGVTVWYGGETKSRVIPLKTFKRDCVNWWDCKAINPDALPKWFKPGVRFSLHGRGALIQATVRDTKNLAQTFHTVDVRNSELKLRRIRFNFASCLAVGEAALIMVDLQDVLRYGYRRLSRWDKLKEDDVIDELFDLYDDY